MPITVLSPFSGRPVKIRDQDLGRAVRDEENRIFYVLKKSDGSGYYGAPTRTGNPRDEQRYLELEKKVGQAHEVSAQRQAEVKVHDATGRRRSSLRGKLIVFVLLLIVAAIVAFRLGVFEESWWNPAPDPVAPPGTESTQNEAP